MGQVLVRHRVVGGKSLFNETKIRPGDQVVFFKTEKRVLFKDGKGLLFVAEKKEDSQQIKESQLRLASRQVGEEYGEGEFEAEVNIISVNAGLDYKLIYNQEEQIIAEFY
jgi:hypothetical protein